MSQKPEPRREEWAQETRRIRIAQSFLLKPSSIFPRSEKFNQPHSFAPASRSHPTILSLPWALAILKAVNPAVFGFFPRGRSPGIL